MIFFLLVAVFWALLLFSILHVLAINFHFQAWQDEWGTLARGLWVSARLQGSTTNSFWCFRQCTLCAKARYQRLKNSSSPDFLSPIFLNPKYESHSNYPEFMTLVVPRFAMSNGSTTLKIFSFFRPILESHQNKKDELTMIKRIMIFVCFLQFFQLIIDFIFHKFFLLI